jgi:hypothetical protein
MKNVETLLKEILAAQSDIATQLEQLNKNLVSGAINIRTHHPLCVVPPNADYTVSQMDVLSTYLVRSIQTGAVVLPGKNEAANVAPADVAGGRS